MNPPHDEEVEQAIRGAENENYKGISKLILQGDGYRLVGATSSNEEVQMFLDDLPDSLVNIVVYFIYAPEYDIFLTPCSYKAVIAKVCVRIHIPIIIDYKNLGVSSLFKVE